MHRVMCRSGAQEADVLRKGSNGESALTGVAHPHPPKQRVHFPELKELPGSLCVHRVWHAAVRPGTAAAIWTPGVRKQGRGGGGHRVETEDKACSAGI